MAVTKNRHITLKSLGVALPAFFKLLRQGRLSVLIYHRVLPEYDFMRPMEPTAKKFDWQMEVLAKYFNPLALHQALRLMDEGRLPPRAVCVTFDDGYADNVTTALPILKKWGIPATIFVASGFINDGRMWNDRVIEAVKTLDKEHAGLSSVGLNRLNLQTKENRYKAAGTLLNKIKYLNPEERASAVNNIEKLVRIPPLNLMMTDQQIIEADRQGVEIGAHTVSHPILNSLSDESAFNEISESKKQLEALLNKKVRYFAYPNGKPNRDYSDNHVAIVKKLGFEAALSTQWGVSTKATDRWQIPRFTPWDTTPFRFACRLHQNTFRKV